MCAVRSRGVDKAIARAGAVRNSAGGTTLDPVVKVGAVGVNVFQRREVLPHSAGQAQARSEIFTVVIEVRWDFGGAESASAINKTRRFPGNGKSRRERRARKVQGGSCAAAGAWSAGFLRLGHCWRSSSRNGRQKVCATPPSESLGMAHVLEARAYGNRQFYHQLDSRIASLELLFLPTSLPYH